MEHSMYPQAKLCTLYACMHVVTDMCDGFGKLDHVDWAIINQH